MQKVLEILLQRRDRAGTIALVVLFRALLDLSYGILASGMFSSVGYEYSPRGIVGVSVSYLFTIVLAALFSPDLGRASRIVVFYLFLFTYVPASTLFAQHDVFSPVPYVLLTICFFLLIIGIRVRFPEPSNSPAVRFRNGLSLGLSLAVTGITLAILLAKYGVPTRIPSLIEVYEVRGLYKETVSRFFGYIVGWQGNVLNVFLFMAGILRRSVPLVTGALLFQLYLYSITGFKSLFFSFLFILWFGIGLKFFSRYLAQYLVGTVSFSLVASILGATYAREWVLLPAIFLDRLYFVPARLFYYYYDFFSRHYVDWFAQHLPLNLFLSSNYRSPIPYVIGDYYFGGAVTSANANLFAAGYANLGTIGYLLVTFILVVVLRGLDHLSIGKNRYLVLSLVAMPMFSLTNGSLLTTLLTHGFLVGMMIVFLLPQDSRTSG